MRHPHSPNLTHLIATTALAIAVLVAGCSSAPQPPTVDDSVRRPVNNAQALELQRCVGELSASRIALTEATHRAQRAVAGAAVQAARAAERAADRAADNCAAPPEPGKTGANQVFVVPFGLGSSSFELQAREAEQLAQAVAGAQLVVVRGRTDASADSAAETALARRRAQAAADYLVARAGLAPKRLRLQWQGAGDPMAVNQRERNRRVEVEVYAAAPDVSLLTNAAP